MTRTRHSPPQKRLTVTVVNLAELLKTEFRREQTAAIVIAVETQGLAKYEITASWDRDVFDLVGNSTREFRVDREMSIRKKSVWQFRTLPSNRALRSVVQFWVRSGGFKQAASLFLRTVGPES